MKSTDLSCGDTSGEAKTLRLWARKDAHAAPILGFSSRSCPPPALIMPPTCLYVGTSRILASGQTGEASCREGSVPRKTSAASFLAPHPRRQTTASVLPRARFGRRVALMHSVIVAVATAVARCRSRDGSCAETSRAKSSIQVTSIGLAA